MDHAGFGDDIWDVIEYHIPRNKRAKIARELIGIFDAQGYDMHGTELWREAFQPCPACNHNNDGRAYQINKCKNCGGKGEVPR
jgi:hypothetical protein